MPLYEAVLRLSLCLLVLLMVTQSSQSLELLMVTQFSKCTSALVPSHILEQAAKLMPGHCLRISFCAIAFCQSQRCLRQILLESVKLAGRSNQGDSGDSTDILIRLLLVLLPAVDLHASEATEERDAAKNTFSRSRSVSMQSMEDLVGSQKDAGPNQMLLFLVDSGLGLIVGLLLCFPFPTANHFQRDTTQKIFVVLIALRVTIPVHVELDALLVLAFEKLQYKARTLGLNQWRGFFRGVLWCVSALFVLHHCGFSMNLFLSSLGVGSVVFGLAAQATLRDAFGTLVILLSPPFAVGDFITVEPLSSAGQIAGTVLEIGLRSTKVLCLDHGEVLHIPNALLAANSVKNNTQAKDRRVVLSLEVAPNTPVAKLRLIPDMVKAVVESVSADSSLSVVTSPIFASQDLDLELLETLGGPDEGKGKLGLLRFHQASLMSISAKCCEFTVCYYVNSADGDVWRRCQHELNLGIMSALNTAGIHFAYDRRIVMNDDK